MIQAYKKFWQGSFVFNKRTSRKDFWFALLVHFIIFVILLKGYHFFDSSNYFQLSVLWQAISSFLLLIFWAYFLGSLPAFISLTVRRLNDAALPWGLIFLNFVFIVGSFVLLVLNILPSSSKQTKIAEFELDSQPSFTNQKEANSIADLIISYFKNYFEFRGQTSRKNFWLSQGLWLLSSFLFVLLINLSAQFEALLFGNNLFETSLIRLFFGLFLLGTFFPQLTIHIRRLRDAGLSNLGLSLLLGSTAGLLIFYKILTRTIKLSYTANHYQLVQYLLFLLAMIFLLCLIIVEITPRGELKTDKPSALFQKID